MATCCMSGNIPDEPVVSLKSGHLFEKRLISKYIELNGTCPITKQPLALGDLLSVVQKDNTSVVKPRAPTGTSFPSMLNALQNEWDAALLQTFTLQQQLDGVRQELAYALYQQDASNRVIARLMKERDEARALLQNIDKNVQKSLYEGFSEDKMSDHSGLASVNFPGISPIVVKDLEATKLELEGDVRKQRNKERTKIVNEYMTHAGEYTSKVLTTVPEEITCMSTKVELNNSKVDHSGASNHLYYTVGYNTGSIRIFQGQDCIQTISVSTKSISHLVMSSYTRNDRDGTSYILAAQGNTVYVFAATPQNPTYSLVHTFTDAKASVTDVKIHPCGYLALIASIDTHLYIFNLETGATQEQLQTSTAVMATDVHPDGHIVLVATTEKILLYKFPELEIGATLDQTETKHLKVSENGYMLVTATNNSVNVWDLRKNAVVTTHPLQNVSSIDVDISGTYSMVADATEGTVEVFKIKNWAPVATYKVAHPVTANFTQTCKEFIVATANGETVCYIK